MFGNYRPENDLLPYVQTAVFLLWGGQGRDDGGEGSSIHCQDTTA